MAICRFLHHSAFDPAEAQALAETFDRICRELKLESETDPVRELVARKVIEFAESNSRDPELIRAFVLSEIQSISRHTGRRANAATRRRVGIAGTK
jgi:hypothetical protein